MDVIVAHVRASQGPGHKMEWPEVHMHPHRHTRTHTHTHTHTRTHTLTHTRTLWHRHTHAHAHAHALSRAVNYTRSVCDGVAESCTATRPYEPVRASLCLYVRACTTAQRPSARRRDLRGNGISGTLPASLSALTALTQLCAVRSSERVGVCGCIVCVRARERCVSECADARRHAGTCVPVLVCACLRACVFVRACMRACIARIGSWRVAGT